MDNKSGRIYLVISALLWPLLCCEHGRALEVLDIRPGETNNLLLHVHIPKTGGTTLSNNLAELFASRVVKCDVGGSEWGRSFADVLTAARRSGLVPGPNHTCNFLSYEGGLKWMTSALDAYGVPAAAVRPLVLLRQPLERRLSGILHGRRLEGDERAAHSYARQNSPDAAEYHSSMSQQLVCPAPDMPPAAAWATRPGNYWYRPCRFTLQQLSAAVRSAFWVGLTEWYRESLCVLAFQLSAFNPQACACATAAQGQRQGPEPEAGPEQGQGEGPELGVAQRHAALLPETGDVAAGGRGLLLPSVDNASPLWQTASAQFSVSQIQRLAEMDRADGVVYAAALVRFLEDVREVERRTGTRVLCVGPENDGWGGSGDGMQGGAEGGEGEGGHGGLAGERAEGGLGGDGCALGGREEVRRTEGAEDHEVKTMDPGGRGGVCGAQ